LSRRQFLAKSALAATAASIPLAGLTASEAFAAPVGSAARARARNALEHRIDPAQSERDVPIPLHPNNGDESLYPARIGNFSKGMPHDSFGEVDQTAYAAYLLILQDGSAAAFESLTLGGSVKMVDPQAAYAFDLEGTDSHQMSQPPAPALSSAWRAGEAVENYWMAALRDVPFSQYVTHPLADLAIDDLNALSDFRGPRDPNTRKVTPSTLFRGNGPGMLSGPWVSQFLYLPMSVGALPIDQRFVTYLPIADGGSDFLTDYNSWLAARNGQGPFPPGPFDPTPRYIRSGRDLAELVHMDVLYQHFLLASDALMHLNAPLNPGNPYLTSKTQTGFGTFGYPHIQAMLAEVCTRALKAVWYEKWLVHRALRPEDYGGLVHLTMTHQRDYPLHPDVLNSQALQQVFSSYGTYLMPQAFPEGCPQHPSYGAGHATVAGAAVTILKAMFDESFVIPHPVAPSDDGLTLLPYSGADAGALTVGGELNKLAVAIGIGRNIAGVHWRSDFEESIKLGEEVAIAILRDQKACYNENFSGFTFTRFDGTSITV
jgi:hypothetical protein